MMKKIQQLKSLQKKSFCFLNDILVSSTFSKIIKMLLIGETKWLSGVY